MLQQTREQSGPMSEADARALHWTIDDLASRAPPPSPSPPQPETADTTQSTPLLATAQSIEQSIRTPSASAGTGAGNPSPMQAAADDGWDTPADAASTPPPPPGKSGMR